VISSVAALDRWWPRLMALVRRSRYAISALDQIALSLFGFALNLVLVRVLSATDFGIVSLWLSVSLLAIGVQNALVNGPLSVYLPATRDPGAARRLQTALGLVNLVTIAVTAVAVVAINLMVDAEWTPRDFATGLAIPLFIAFTLFREYYRSLAYSRHDMAMLLWTDLPYLATTTLCLVAMLVWPARFGTLAGAFLALSLGCAVSQLCLRRRRRTEPEPPLFRRGTLAPYRAIAGEVSWSLVGVVANHVETRSYTYVTTSMIGLAALAAINIVGVLFRPITVLSSAWAKTSLPQLSGMLARREIAAFERMLGWALGATAIGSVVWYLALLACWDPVERFVLAGKYPDAVALLLPWAAASAASTLRYVAGIGLVAARQFKFLAHVQIVCGALAAAATAAMILWQGMAGAMWGIAIGNAACLAMIFLRLRGIRRPDFLAAHPQWDAPLDKPGF
jgi:O-antigen/teichoic acid export membrane protein